MWLHITYNEEDCVTRTPRDTYPTELTPDTGLSHWWALPLVLPHTPRLGGDRLGFF